MSARTGLAAAALAAALLTAAPVAALAGYALRGGVAGNGATAGAGMASGARRLHGTAGQGAVGLSSGSQRVLSSGFWCFGGTRVLAVDDDPTGVPPAALAFAPPWPNPAGGTVRFAVSLPAPARADLRVLDVQGRVVAIVCSGSLGAGVHRLAWDARGAGAGVYFARLVVDGAPVGTRRLTLRP